ncbi:MAG: hypothetical protein JRJ39_00340, partial [Deltaproteobacteria bacterium]|nr:hypothetical protein [Deltaproteobacteria bacterium]
MNKHKIIQFTLIFLLIPVICFARTKTPSKDVTVSDAGGYFSSTDVEGVLQEIGAGAGTGQSNTASNTGSVGVGLSKQKTGVDLEFYKIFSENNILTAILSGTDYFSLTVNEGNISHDAIADVSAEDHQDLVTVDVNADTLLSLTNQELGLDTQLANKVFAGPAAGGAAIPSFRDIVDNDIPDTITVSNYVRKSMWTDHDNYPDACSAGQAVTGLGDTLACATFWDALTDMTLADGSIYIGDVSNNPVAQVMTGDITITNGGVTSIGVDKIKDTMPDWGTGAGQIDSDDIPDHNSHSVRDTFVHIINRGKAEAITITLTGGLGISWTTGEIYDETTNSFIATEAGSGNLTNTAENYLKWVSGTTLTISTTSTSGDEILISPFSVYDGNINGYRETTLMDATQANTRRGLRAIYPTFIDSGMSVHEDTDVTNALDVTMDAGVFWKDAIEKKTPVEIKSRTTAMVRNFHTASVWDSDTNAQIETTNYDNGTGLTAIPANKYVKAKFIFMNGKIGFVYPRAYFNNVADALDAALPASPLGLASVPVLTGVVYKQGAANFTAAVWTDERVGIAEGTGGLVTDHDQLGSLAWTISKHTSTALAIAGFDGAGAASEYTTTGSGTVLALATSPTLVTPALGTPASGVMTNVTGTASGLTAGAVTNATLTTALTVNTGTLELKGNAANNSVLTVGAGAVSVSGANTGDNTVATSGDAAVDFFGAGVSAVTDATACTEIEGNLL